MSLRQDGDRFYWWPDWDGDGEPAKPLGREWKDVGYIVDETSAWEPIWASGDRVEMHTDEEWAAIRAGRSITLPSHRPEARFTIKRGDMQTGKPIERAIAEQISEGFARSFDRAMAKADGDIKALAAVTKTPKIVWGDPAPISRASAQRALTDIERYAYPQRYVVGFDGTASVDILTTMTRLNAATAHQLKETTMTDIDQNEFQPRTKAQKVKAERLAHVHLDQLVTVTLPSGAEVTDILKQVIVGRGLGNLDSVRVELANIHLRTEWGPQGFDLEPDSVVLVRKRRA